MINMITTINEFRKIYESVTEETMTFWHGGNLDDYEDGVSHKSGQWEHGPGLYLTTQYDVVQKYSRGSRKLYKVTVLKGVDINDVYLPVKIVAEFVNTNVIKSKIKDVMSAIERRLNDDTINADTFLNILINNNAIKNNNTNELRKFFVKNGIDYSMVDNAFGWGEKMMVVFNMNKIINVVQFKSTDSMDDYNLPKVFSTNESFNQSEYLKWKRKNVTIRGMQEAGVENGGSAILGRGLYSAALSNNSMAKGYGTVHFVVNAIPKKPIIFNTLNDWEIWFYNTLVFGYSKALGKDYPDKRDFNAKTTIEDEVQKLGYDGVIVKGREMVNYKPENVMYFKNENQLQDYYRYVIVNKVQETKEMDDNLANDLILHKDTLEPIDSDVWVIDRVVDVITDQEEIKKYEGAENLQTTNLTYKSVDRNDIIWITCMLKPRNNSTAYPLGELGVLQCKVLNTYYGLNKLNQLSNSAKILR